MKIKKVKSAYASGVPPCPVTIERAKKLLNKTEMLDEYNGLIIILAAILEQNNGRVLVTPESIATVKKQKRVLQIIPGPLALSVQFDSFSNVEEPAQSDVLIPQVPNNFLTSSVAQEAREFLAQQKETNDSI